MSTTALHGKSFIGKEPSAEGRRSFLATNPATGATLEPHFREASLGEANRALSLAERAFTELRCRPPAERAAFLDRIADEILELGDALIERAVEETGLPSARIQGERARTVGQLRMFANLIREGSWVDARIDHAAPERKPAPKPDVRRMLVSIGPVIVFGASNFPLAFSVAGGDTASALAAGNPVIVKAHRAHPGTGELVARAILQAAEKTDMPDGVFSFLHGAGSELGAHLVRHPAAKAVAFTGSLSGGRALFDMAASRPEPIPVDAEMSSVNPVFVLPGALKARADELAAGLHQSVTLGVGQFCTNPGLLVGLKSDEWSLLTTRLKDLISSTSPGTMLHVGIREGYEAGTRNLASVSGVSVAARSSLAADAARTQAQAMLFTAEASTFLEKRELSEEIFGPSTLLLTCGSRAELESIARNLHGHLTATVQGTAQDLLEYAELVRILETKVGRLLFNGYPTGVEVCPSMHHGGPYPATSYSHFTSVGTAAILRFTRPLCYQGFPEEALPPELRDSNERGIWRLVDGQFGR